MLDSQSIDIDTSFSVPDQLIPALAPYGLDRVPGLRNMPGVEVPPGWRPTPGEPSFEDPTWRAEHKDYTRELTTVVRPWIHERGNADPEFAAFEREQCAADPNYFGMVYGWIYEPKPMAGEDKNKPYAKFAYQCDNTALQYDWVFRDWTDQAKLWRSKSRQLGISWDDEHFDTWFYLFCEGQIKLTSRSEDWVDKGDSVETMFGKIKYVLRRLDEHTPYLLPAPYKRLLSPPNYKHMQLINPATGTAIYGESANRRVGRGGTYTYGRADEDAAIPDLEETLAAMESCPRVFLASTESFDIGMEHFDGWQSAKRERPETVREYNWRDNAYLDLAWERRVLASATNDEQRQRVMREYFRDPFAGFSQWVYPEARAIAERNIPYDPSRPLDITMDHAGSGDDFALMACQATAFDGHEGFHVLWGYQKRLPNPLRVAHMATGLWPEAGDACYGWEPDREEREIGKLLYGLWLDGCEVRWFSDPAADQIHSGASFLMMFRDLTRELRDREVDRLAAQAIADEEAGRPFRSDEELRALRVPVSPRFNALKGKRLFGDREYAFRAVLPFVSVQVGVPSARRVKECAFMTSYNALADAAVTAPKRKHDQYSHHASNLENYSLYLRMGFVDPLDNRELRRRMKQVRGGLSTPGRRAIPGSFGKRALPPPRGLPSRPPPLGAPQRASPGGLR